MSINIPAFIASLRFMAEGWLGIFVVMGVIIACICCLNKAAAYMEEKTDKENS